MARDTAHPLQPRTNHEGMSRRLAVLACKRAIGAELQARLKASFTATDDERVKQAPEYRLWSSTNRASQDRMWQVLAEQIDADYARIAAAADSQSANPAGSLTLSTSDAMPSYIREACIHGQPGGYFLDRDGDDLAAGILYEAGGNLYAMGQGIGGRDSKGERLIAHLRSRFPRFAPRRILEMGCSAGAQSADYPAAFPDAECHAIDVAPSMLRFAHARAEALGACVHFHQSDAAATPFPDGHFDLIVSHNLFHEVAAEHAPKILAECHRLLADGGICLHQDVPTQVERLDDFGRFLSAWQRDNNDEPFWLDFAEANLPALAIQAGFAADAVDARYLEAIDGPIPWYVVTAAK